MKKTVNANIGGMVFTINEDAFDALSVYLNTLRKFFKESEGSDEIMEDIEVRIAEILKEHMGKRVVVDMSDVEVVKSTIGYPQDFETPESEEESQKANKKHAESGKKQIYLGKRLYRNPDDKILGGVCSGLGAYFGIDPVWIRLAFVIATVVFGTGFWLYIILWIIIPEAKTPTEKLQMRGEPVNVDNIKQTFSEEFEGVKERVQNLASEAQSWVRDEKKKDTVKGFIDNLGSLIRGLLRALSQFVFITLSVLAIILLSLLVFSLLTSSTVMAVSLPLLQQYLFTSSWQMWLIVIGGILVFLIPVIWLIIRLFASGRMSKRARNILDISTAVAWGIAIWMIIPAALSLAYDFNERAVVRESHDLNPSSDTLYVELRDEAFIADRVIFDDSWMKIHSKDLDIVGDTLIIHDFELRKSISPDSLFHLDIIYSARGKNRYDARKRARAININYQLIGNRLIIEPYFDLGNEPYRMQSVRAKIEVPQGKTVIVNREN